MRGLRRAANSRDDRDPGPEDGLQKDLTKRIWIARDAHANLAREGVELIYSIGIYGRAGN